MGKNNKNKDKKKEKKEQKEKKQETKEEISEVKPVQVESKQDAKTVEKEVEVEEAVVEQPEQQVQAVQNPQDENKSKDKKKDKKDKPKKTDEEKEVETKERKERTTFVGNVPLETTNKDLQKLFKKYGEIEHIWFRSIACDHESKKTHKGKIISGEFGQQKQSKNAYVLFKTKEQAHKAAQNLNQIEIGGKHIRVDLEDSQKDFDSTVFIGNLPWVLDEEDVRSHFEECGKILNVRLIRDKENFIGKGIGYIQFSTKEEMRKAVDTKSGSLFKGRELRVKKAVEPKRLEKKQKKKREAKENQKSIQQKEKGEKTEEIKTPEQKEREEFKSQKEESRKLYMERQAKRENAMLRIGSKQNKRQKPNDNAQKPKDKAQAKK